MDELEKIHKIDSVAFELLGPPRLSKLLHEINLLRKVAGGMKSIIKESPEALQQKVMDLLNSNSKLRSEIISIGIPILLPDGKSLLRGNHIKIQWLACYKKIIYMMFMHMALSMIEATYYLLRVAEDLSDIKNLKSYTKTLNLSFNI